MAPSRKPLMFDLFCGLGGATEGFLANGWDCIGIDNERHQYGDHYYPAQLWIQDILTISGDQLRSADFLWASPPCQFFSYTAMPWSKAKALAAEVRADPERLERELALFNACFRIQREACEASGRHIPLIVENVRGAIPWVGRSRFSYGSFHFWGNIPALMPTGRNKPEFILDDIRAGQRRQVDGIYSNGIKSGGDWFSSGAGCSPQRRAGSNSTARKYASAQVAKIPFEISTWIAKCFKPMSSAA